MGRRYLSCGLLLGFAFLVAACLPSPSPSSSSGSATVSLPPATVDLPTSTPSTSGPDVAQLVTDSHASPSEIPSTNAADSGLITRAVMADDATCDTREPGGITNSFPSSQGTFHAVVTLANAPPATRVKVAWVIVDDGVASDKDKQVAEFELAAEGSRNLDFTFKPNGIALTPGTYRANIYIADKLDRSLAFSVTPELPTPVSANVIANAVISSDTTCTKKDPVGIDVAFPSEQAMFHTVVTVSDAPKGTHLQIDWTVVDDGNPSDSNNQIATQGVDMEGSRNVDFVFKPQGGNLPPGKYRSDIFLDGALVQSLPFTVTE